MQRQDLQGSYAEDQNCCLTCRYVCRVWQLLGGMGRWCLAEVKLCFQGTETQHSTIGVSQCEDIVFLWLAQSKECRLVPRMEMTRWRLLGMGFDGCMEAVAEAACTAHLGAGGSCSDGSQEFGLVVRILSRGLCRKHRIAPQLADVR